VLVWIAAVREQNPPREANYSQSIPIEIIPPTEGLVNTTPLPEAVRLRLLAPESSWTALTPSKFKASIDLSGLDAGFSDVPIEVDVSDDRIEIVERFPSEVTVNLETLETITVPVSVEVLDAPPLGYISRLPEAKPQIVDVTGPASMVGQVHQAVSEIFIRNSKETLQSLRDVIIRGRDGRVIRGLAVDPAQVEVTLPIEQRFGYKDASVRVVVEGQVASGYRVSNISVDPPTLTVVGNPQGLNEIAGFVETTPINLDQATENIIRTVPLSLPDGVATVSSRPQNNGPEGVEVTVEITPIEDSINLQRSINQQGIDPGFWWLASPTQADVFLSGPLPQLQALRGSDVEVIVDLFGLEPGVHKVQPTVFLPEGLQVDTILPDTIEVKIGSKIERPVSQLGLSSNYTWRASPSQVNLNLSGSREQLDSLRPNDVRVILDLADLDPGIHKLRPIISFPEGLELESVSPQIIDAIIQLKVPVTSTPTITATVATRSP
jgi:YbbR domain-containing protein